MKAGVLQFCSVFAGMNEGWRQACGSEKMSLNRISKFRSKCASHAAVMTCSAASKPTVETRASSLRASAALLSRMPPATAQTPTISPAAPSLLTALVAQLAPEAPRTLAGRRLDGHRLAPPRRLLLSAVRSPVGAT